MNAPAIDNVTRVANPAPSAAPLPLTDEVIERIAAKLAPLVARELAKQTPPPPEQLLDVHALATRLDVSVRQLRHFDDVGKIPLPLKIGRAKRWRPDEIHAWQAAGMPDRKRWEAIKAARKWGSSPSTTSTP